MKGIPQLQRTTDYKMFKKIDSNREINKNHLKKLKVGIERKNLLYLFPIVINKGMEVVDGQHRLKAAEELGLEVFYLVDDNITKADIAMVNSNRKAWAIYNYIDFYASEGKIEFKHLKWLMKDYPRITATVGARLIDRDAMFYGSGGGKHGVNMKVGILNDDCYVVAKVVAELCEKLSKTKNYAFSGYFMLDVKNAIIQSGALAATAADTIYTKRHCLPNVADPLESHLSTLKEMLGISSFRPYSSKRDVDAFLESQSTRARA